MLGIFDSGLGGLTVVKEILNRHSSADFLYLGDTARAPYGDKSITTICQYAQQDVDFLFHAGIKHIAVACNSVSAVAMTDLRLQFPDIAFYDVIRPAIIKIVEANPQRIAVIGTRATISSGVYEIEIIQHLPRVEITSLACPLFVPWVEEGFADSPETDMVVAHYLSNLKDFQPDLVVLACTHYPFLESAIARYLGPNVQLVNSAKALADSLPAELFFMNTANQKFAFTDLSPHTIEIAHAWLGEGIELQPAKL